MGTASMYTRVFHPNYVGITVSAFLILVLVVVAVVYLIRRFARSRNARPSSLRGRGLCGRAGMNLRASPCVWAFGRS